MSSKNVVLTDKDGNQIAPATTAEQVQWDSNQNIKQVINRISGAPFSFVSEAVAQADQRILMNLTGNDLDFGDEMKIHVSATTNSTSGSCKLAINDTKSFGWGIDEVQEGGQVVGGESTALISIQKLPNDYLLISIITSSYTNKNSFLLQNEDIDYIKISVEGAPSLVFKLGSKATAFSR